MARIMVRRAGKGWSGQPLRRKDGKCVTYNPNIEAAETSGQKSVAKIHAKSRAPQIPQPNDRIPYYQRRPQKPLVVKVKVKRNRPVHKVGDGEIIYPFGSGAMKEAQFKKNRKLKANTVNKEEKVEPPTRRFAFRQDPQDKSKLKRYSIHNLPKAAEPQPTVNEKEMAKCKICGVSVPKHMAKHLRKVHGKPTLVRLSKKQLKSVNTWLNSTRRIPDTEEKVVLISRRGTRVKDGQCAECGKRVQPCWKYAISNRGPVFLCGPCKPEVFERSFGFSETVDALDIASRGGGFETNRRRH